MDALPNEILFSIFDWLGAKSLMACRMVCRRWKFCVDGTKLKTLVVRGFDDFRLTKWWYHTYRPVDDDDIIERIPSFGQCIKLIPLNIVHVTCLIINTPIHFGDANVLNRFQQLRHLECQNFIFQRVPPPKIKLPHLKILKIGRTTYSIWYNFDEYSVPLIEIEAPNLEILSCGVGLRDIRISHTKSIKHLQIDDKENKLKRFENVEIFKCFRPESIAIDILEQLPKLKEIHLVDGHYRDICGKFLDFNKTATAMNRLIEQKISLGKTDLKLYFLGELLDDGSKIFEDHGFREKFQQIFVV